MASGGGGLAVQAGAVAREPGSGRFMTGSQDLTPKQRAFVDAYLANGCKQTEAARDAGYQTPGVDGWRLLRNPAIIRVLHEETSRLTAAGGMIGLRTLVKIAQDDAANEGARVSAGKWLAEAAGLGLANRKASVLPGVADDKPLEDMSLRELEAFISAGRRELDSMRSAIPAEVTVISGPDPRNDTPDADADKPES